jgi:hypothetical protein
MSAPSPRAIRPTLLEAAAAARETEFPYAVSEETDSFVDYFSTLSISRLYGVR